MIDYFYTPNSIKVALDIRQLGIGKLCPIANAQLPMTNIAKATFF